MLLGTDPILRPPFSQVNAPAFALAAVLFFALLFYLFSPAAPPFRTPRVSKGPTTAPDPLSPNTDSTPPS
jgi:hypothetical protein